MLILIALYVAFISGVCLAGWAHQKDKSPEQQMLEYLVDSNDPYVVEYSYKTWGPSRIAAMSVDGQRFALI